MANHKYKSISHCERTNNPAFTLKITIEPIIKCMPIHIHTSDENGILMRKQSYSKYEPHVKLRNFKFHDFDLIKLQISGAIDNLKPVSFGAGDRFTQIDNLRSAMNNIDKSSKTE